MPVWDDSTSVPVVLPDGGILYGALPRYPYLQGHLMKFSSSGRFLASPFARTARCAITSFSMSPSVPPTRRSPIDGDGRILTQNNGHLFVVGDDEDDD